MTDEVRDGAVYSWLVSIRFTGDYGGDKHVSVAEAEAAVNKARTILEAARRSHGRENQSQLETPPAP